MLLLWNISLLIYISNDKYDDDKDAEDKDAHDKYDDDNAGW